MVMSPRLRRSASVLFSLLVFVLVLLGAAGSALPGGPGGPDKGGQVDPNGVGVVPGIS